MCVQWVLLVGRKHLLKWLQLHMCVVWWLWNLEKLFAWPAMPNSFDLDALNLSFLPFVKREQLLGHNTRVFLIALHWRWQWMQQSQRNAIVNIWLAMFAANFLYAVCSPLICNKQQCSKMFIDKLQHSWHTKILFHLSLWVQISIVNHFQTYPRPPWTCVGLSLISQRKSSVWQE